MDEGGQVGVPQVVRQFVLQVPVVDVDGHGAELDGGEQRFHGLDGVAGVKADMVAGTDALAGQVVGEAVGLVFELAVGDLAVAADRARAAPGRRRRHARTGRPCSVPWVETRTCYCLEQEARPEAASAKSESTDRSSPHALIEQREHVLVVTMNRPEARNALSAPMMALHAPGLGPGRHRPGHPGVRADRGGRRVLRGRRPQGDDQRPPGFTAGRLRPVGDRAAAQGAPPDQAADRRRGGAGDRRRHRDPPGAPTSGWPARARGSASPRRAGACSRWAARRCGCHGRSPTRWPRTCC